MLKLFTAAVAATAAAASLAGSATEASAGYGRCTNCGPVAPTYNVRTVNKYINVTRYRDVAQPYYVPRVHRHINVTQVRPVYNYHTVTRVNHYPVPVVRHVYESRVHYLPPVSTYSGSTVHTWSPGCGCGY